MRIIKPGFEFMEPIDGEKILKNIERCGRTCYKSESLITSGSSYKFVQNLISRGHESVIEHEKITVKVICDRGISHEIVRHRIASYSQESTRYCNYQREKFGGELTFIKPLFWEENSKEYNIWYRMMEQTEIKYMELVNLGIPPEEARSILPNSLKTEVVITMNLREWRHFFKLRTSKSAHPQMREIANIMLKKMKEEIPVLFEDIVTYD